MDGNDDKNNNFSIFRVAGPVTKTYYGSHATVRMLLNYHFHAYRCVAFIPQFKE